MRRENRKKHQKKISTIDRIIVYAEIGAIVLTIIVFVLFLYSNKLDDNIKENTSTLEEFGTLEKENQNIQSASTDIGKSVEESKNEKESEKENENNKTSSNIINQDENQNKVKEVKNIENNQSKSNTLYDDTKSASNNKKTSIPSNSENIQEPTKKQDIKKELKFEKPVEGEVVKVFAKDNLIYSETLQEWTTHLGIDIKAEKTTVVNSAEKGIIKSIKNDPRFGLTIIIEHEDGFQTMYSNLLTSEFVVEGENVEKGQAIGTVGNTGAFEIADEPHLHFELLKNGIQEDPNIYIKY